MWLLRTTTTGSCRRADTDSERAVGISASLEEALARIALSRSAPDVCASLVRLSEGDGTAPLSQDGVTTGSVVVLLLSSLPPLTPPAPVLRLTAAEHTGHPELPNATGSLPCTFNVQRAAVCSRFHHVLVGDERAVRSPDNSPIHDDISGKGATVQCYRP